MITESEATYRRPFTKDNTIFVRIDKSTLDVQLVAFANSKLVDANRCNIVVLLHRFGWGSPPVAMLGDMTVIVPAVQPVAILPPEMEASPISGTRPSGLSFIGLLTHLNLDGEQQWRALNHRVHRA